MNPANAGLKNDISKDNEVTFVNGCLSPQHGGWAGETDVRCPFVE